jgi:hypothetical protein
MTGRRAGHSSECSRSANTLRKSWFENSPVSSGRRTPVTVRNSQPRAFGEPGAVQNQESGAAGPEWQARGPVRGPSRRLAACTPEDGTLAEPDVPFPAPSDVRFARVGKLGPRLPRRLPFAIRLPRVRSCWLFGLAIVVCHYLLLGRSGHPLARSTSQATISRMRRTDAAW